MLTELAHQLCGCPYVGSKPPCREEEDCGELIGVRFAAP